MDNTIEDWARSNFYESSSVGFTFEEVDYHELQMFVHELSLEESGWTHYELGIESVKSYDEDGNSFYIGVLILDSRGKTAKEFLKLAPYFDELYL